MDKKVVRASYDACLVGVARLSAYATSSPVLITEVHVQQDILATNDLISFCIHARRLIDNIDSKDLLYQTVMDSNDGMPPISIGKIIGCLIHHDTLEIIRCETRLNMLRVSSEGFKGDDFFAKVENEMNKLPYSEPIMPLILFKSDRSEGMRLINLVIFLQIFSKEILLEVIKQNIWLQDDLLKDSDMAEDILHFLSRIK